MATAQAAVIQCVDPRVKKRIRELLADKGLTEETWSLHTAPGASLNVNDIRNHIRLAIEELGAKTVYIIDHTDCLAYKMTEADTDAEHVRHLVQARFCLKADYPSVEVHTLLMRLTPEEFWSFEEIQG